MKETRKPRLSKFEPKFDFERLEVYQLIRRHLMMVVKTGDKLPKARYWGKNQRFSYSSTLSTYTSPFPSPQPPGATFNLGIGARFDLVVN